MENPAWDDEQSDSAYDFNAPMFTDFDEDGQENFGDAELFGDELLQNKQNILDICAVPESWISQLNQDNESLPSPAKVEQKVFSETKQKKPTAPLNDENSMNSQNVHVVDEIILDEITFDSIENVSSPVKTPVETPVDDVLHVANIEETTSSDVPISNTLENASSNIIKTEKSVPSYLKSTKAFSARESSNRVKDSNAKKNVGKGKNNLTRPITPFLSTKHRARADVPQPSSTTQELQLIARQREENERKRQMQKEMFEKSKQAVPEEKKIERKPLTKPETPHFKTTLRNRTRVNDSPKSLPQEKRSQAHNNKPLKLTKPKPFNLRTDAKPKDVPASSPYVSVAEKVQKFQSKTPARFHTTTDKKPIVTTSDLRLTEPVPVRLTTETRARPSNIPTSAEVEENVMKSMPQFKARPLNKKILSSAGDMGVPKVNKKPLCVPQEFRFQTDSRCGRKRTSSAENTCASPTGSVYSRGSVFSRRSMSSTNTQGGPKITVSQPFNLSTSNRSRVRAASPRVAEVTSKPFKAKPAPKFSRPASVKPPTAPKLTEVQPFHLKGDTIHEAAQRKLQEEIEEKKKKEEMARNFRAQPVPDFSKSPRMSHPSTKPLTEPKTPIALARSVEAQRHMMEKLEQVNAERKYEAQFHSIPLPKTTYVKGFEPVIVPKITQPEEIILNSDIRASERAEFDMYNNNRVENMRYEREREEQRRKEMEEMELKEYRRNLIVKAKPVPDYNELANKYSSKTHHPQKSLTVPESPFLETKQRSQHHD